MIISRTPFRISFFGGGTDYPIWYEKNGGAVLSTTIDKYCYVNCRYLPPFFDYKYRIRYNSYEVTQNISEIKHPSVRECLKFLNIKKGIEMVHIGDLPPLSGIGSSSAFTVGFLNGLYALMGKKVDKKQLALEAIYVEQNLIKENVGSQDQTAAAFGGFNKIEFGGKEKLKIKPLKLSQEKVDFLQDNLMLFFTGYSRQANEIAKEQIRATPSKDKELRIMRQMVDEAENILHGKIDKFNDFGKLLHETWMLKRGLTNLISNSSIDEIYNTAIKAGALGGKLCGAGGGGFILFFVPPERQKELKEKLNLLYVPFRFENFGSQIILGNNFKHEN